MELVGMTRNEMLKQVGRLIREQRWAALASRNGEEVLASMVAYAPEAYFQGLLLHLSRLAPHTRNLLTYPAASLVISAPDIGGGDPQQLPRISFVGELEPIVGDSEEYLVGRERYLRRLPDAERLFSFSDFILFRLIPHEARFVGGFAAAHNLSGQDLEHAARLLDAIPEAS